MTLRWEPATWDVGYSGMNYVQSFAYQSPVLGAAGSGADNGPVVAFSTSGGPFVGKSTVWDFSHVGGIIYAGWLNVWVVASDDHSNDVVGSSADTDNWTYHVTPWDGVTTAEVIAKSEFQQLVCVASHNHFYAKRVMTSPDLTNWTERTTPWDASLGGIYAVAYSPADDLWLAGGYDNVGGPACCLMSSPDAATWTPVVSPFDDNGFGPGLVQGISRAYGDAGWWLSGNLVMAGNEQRVLVFTADLSTFTVFEIPALVDPATTATGWFVIDRPDQLVTGVYHSGDQPVLFSSSDGGASWDSDIARGWDQGLAGIWVADLGLAYAGGFSTISGDYRSIRTSDLVPLPVPSASPLTLWRYFISDLSGAGITDFSKLAGDRSVEVTLNAPLTMEGTVPSDNPQVWLTFTDDGNNDPYLAEGTRLLWGFRRESNSPPYYVVRAATMVQLVEDAAQQDDARTRFQGWDPWHYMMSRPVMDVAGNVIGVNGLSYTNTQASVIIAQLLRNTINNSGFAYVDAGDGSRSGEGAQYQDYGGTAFFAGTLETGPGMEIDIVFAQGTSVGQAWKQITDMDVCDIVLDPIYDPMNRPGYLCELNVYAQAGAVRDEQIFAWNTPGRSLVGLNRQQDGSQRANNVFFRAGQGGWWGDGTILTDGASEIKYGEYWAQQFFPQVTGKNAIDVVNFLAEEQLSLRRDGRETVTFTPAPERSPRPWQDYQLGDRVPVWASQQKFRMLLGEQESGTLALAQYQRIYGWRANISDDALETIDPVLTSPQE